MSDIFFDQQCESVEILFRASQRLKFFEGYIRKKCCTDSVPSSLYDNFRAALFHYMNLKDDLLQAPALTAGVEKHIHSLKEHLDRAFTDACVYTLILAALKLYALLQAKPPVVTTRQRSAILKHMHTVKNLILDIRLSGSTDKRSIDEKVGDTITVIDAMCQFLQGEGIWEKYCKSTRGAIKDFTLRGILPAFDTE